MNKEKLKELKLLAEEKLAVYEVKAEIYRWFSRQNNDREMENKTWEEGQIAFREWHEAFKTYNNATESYFKEMLAQ